MKKKTGSDARLSIKVSGFGTSQAYMTQSETEPFPVIRINNF